MNLKAHQKFVKSLALRAGKLLLKKFGKSKVAVEKGANDFATDADLASERLIISEIKKQYPNCEIIAEETAFSEHKELRIENKNRKGSINKISNPKSKIQNLKFIIDPLDGTKNFHFGLPFWCVSIALQVNGKSVVGVVYCPVTNELFSARRGGGATSNDKKIHVSATRKIAESLVVVEIPRHHDSGKSFTKDIKNFTDVLHRVRRVRAFAAAAYELCLVAKGMADAYLDYSRNTKIWDTAAGSLIVTEAGGRVRDVTPENAPHFNNSVLATNKNLHAEFTRLI